jgi:hypothetical protein
LHDARRRQRRAGFEPKEKKDNPMKTRDKAISFRSHLAFASLAFGALSLGGVGCASANPTDDPGLEGAGQAAGTEAVGETAEAFSGNWEYSWGDTKYSKAPIGTATNRTCFLSGLAGNIQPGVWPNACPTQTGAGLTIDANNNYSLYVDSCSPLNVFARCVNTAAGRTPEVTWRTGQPAQVLGAVTAKRRCFLTNITNTSVYPDEGGAGFKTASDQVRVWNDGQTWFVGGQQSGVVYASARCIDVNQDDGGWLWQAGDPGSRKDKLSGVGSATCLLTGIQGHLYSSDYSDGAYITHDAGLNQFYMNTKNGKAGWANCIQ